MTFESPIYLQKNSALMYFIISKCIVSFEELKAESLLAVASPRLFTTLLMSITDIIFWIVYYIYSVIQNNLNNCIVFEIQCVSFI